MPDAAGKLTVAILALPESTPSTLYGMHEVLESAGRDWGYVVAGSPGESKISPCIVSADGAGFRAVNGLWVEPTASFETCPEPDVVAIPDLLLGPDEDLAGRHAAEHAWLSQRRAAGAVFATACTGAFVLAEAGLLDGCDVTTHWGYCDAMAERYPNVRVHPNRALVISGEGQRFIMAGGGTSWHDLALFLIGRYVGAEEAMRVARLHLLEWHHVGQQPFAALTRTRQARDAVIARCQEWIAQHYDEDSPVSAMAKLSGLAERSFKRRFAQATGMSPLEYVHSLRLEETKLLLETTDLPVEDVAYKVGYEDGSFFSRLFRRKVGLTPAQYRKRFRALRQALERDHEAVNV
ncbi:MAG: helix-turn-helix domain-containing protein [Gammaproteobacteria bacterium]|nr:helix-turn-helix domain-containing protein [Gammaproteobacteria bacterium]